MLILGIESSCDESGVALYDSERGLLANALHTQVAMHADYGGVVPELASRDHVRHLLPLLGQALKEAGLGLDQIDGIAYTQGPGLAGALLVGAAVAESLALSMGCPALPVHHLEGHLLSPLLTENPPAFPFVALLVSGGHTQLMLVEAVGRYSLLGETLDDAAGEAFDKSAKLLGLGYPGGPALSRLAEQGRAGAVRLPRPMLNSGDLDFSFSGLKTAVMNAAKALGESPTVSARADLARGAQDAIVEVLVSKSVKAMRRTGMERMVVAGGVGANISLRTQLDLHAGQAGFKVFYPPLSYCTDNGAMIALAGALRMANGLPAAGTGAFSVRPRWPLSDLVQPI